jgi:hypothetical protein
MPHPEGNRDDNALPTQPLPAYCVRVKIDRFANINVLLMLKWYLSPSFDFWNNTGRA